MCNFKTIIKHNIGYITRTEKLRKRSIIWCIYLYINHITILIRLKK